MHWRSSDFVEWVGIRRAVFKFSQKDEGNPIEIPHPKSLRTSALSRRIMELMCEKRQWFVGTLLCRIEPEWQMPTGLFLVFALQLWNGFTNSWCVSRQEIISVWRLVAAIAINLRHLVDRHAGRISTVRMAQVFDRKKPIFPVQSSVLSNNAGWNDRSETLWSSLNTNWNEIASPETDATNKKWISFN